MLVCLVKHSNLVLMHSILLFSWFMLMSSLPKGESMGTNLVELFANRVVERRNMINNYLRGGELVLRVLGGVDFKGGVNFELLY
jgi:hypothetical protein